ncbi:MAG: response regulator [Gammaproteobacteria bacterium]|nr:response regulator [Gammaproteobacteria bacterium]
MTIFIFDLVHRQSDFLHEQAVAQTSSLAKTLAANSTSWVLSADVFGLQEVIASQDNYPGLEYAIVIDTRGRILGHSDSKLLGKYLNDKTSRRLIDAPAQLSILITNRELIDVAAPIYANLQHIGWARVAINQRDVESGLNIITRNGIIYTLIAILVGVIFAFFMAKGLTLGLKHLVSIADKITQGDRSTRSTLKREDELGQLSDDFNIMLDHLAKNESMLTDVQAELKKSEERFELAMKGANDGLWDWDIINNTVYYSPRWKQMRGYDDTEIENEFTEWKTRIHPDDLPDAMEAIDKHLNDSTSQYQSTHRSLHKDGSYRWLLERGVAVKDASGRALRMVGTTTDITDRINIERELQKSKDELEMRVEERTRELADINTQLDLALVNATQAVQSKSMFLANMSHEIRTPMNGIFGMLDLLKQEQLNSSQLDLVNTAYNSAETLLTILNDILDFSKIEAGKLELEHIDFAIADTIDDVSTLFAQKAQEKNIEIINDIPVELPHFTIGDPTRLRQILSNLINNAIKFTDKGEIVVRVHIQEEDVKFITLCVEVSDTGVGIEADRLDTIFESFSQADGSTTRQYGGTGLGLTIATHLARLMGGDIGVHSTPGEGSTFWFTLKLERSEIDVSPFDSSGLIAQQKILIVDDNATNRFILEKQLQSWGASNFDSTESPETALQLIQETSSKNPYTIVLLDMMMPAMDGLTLARKIVDSDIEQEPHMIMLTSMSGACSKEVLSKNHIISCLTKPVRQSLLYDNIINLCGKEHIVHVTASETISENSDYSNLRILLVEDNKINQKVALAYFKPYNCNIDVANNGREAVELHSNNPFDIIFMDCQMPVMDGFEATSIIRKIETQKNMNRATIIAMTANAMKGDKEKCIATGMDDYISKPYKTSNIKDILSKWAKK